MPACSGITFEPRGGRAGCAGIAQLRGEHLAEQRRALGAIEVERLVAVLVGRVIGELAEAEHRLRPRLHGLLEEVAQVRDRERARYRLLRHRRRRRDHAERRAQIFEGGVSEQREQAVLVGDRQLRGPQMRPDGIAHRARPPLAHRRGNDVELAARGGHRTEAMQRYAHRHPREGLAARRGADVRRECIRELEHHARRPERLSALRFDGDVRKRQRLARAQHHLEECGAIAVARGDIVRAHLAAKIERARRIAGGEHALVEPRDEHHAERHGAHRRQRRDHHARCERLAAIGAHRLERVRCVLARFAKAERAPVEIEVRESGEHRAHALDVARRILIARCEVHVDDAGEDLRPRGERSLVAREPLRVVGQRAHEQRERRRARLLIRAQLLGRDIEARDAHGPALRALADHERTERQPPHALIPVEVAGVLLEIGAFVRVAVGAERDAEPVGPANPVVGRDVRMPGEHCGVCHHAQQIAARHRRRGQLEQREHRFADATAIVDRCIDEVTRHADGIERARCLREIALVITREPQADLVCVQRGIRVEPPPDIRRDRLDLATRVGTREHADTRFARLGDRGHAPRANIVEQALACGHRHVVDEHGIYVAARALDERGEGVADRLAPQKERQRIGRGLGHRERAPATDVIPELLARIERVHGDIRGGREIRQRLELRARQVAHAEHRHR